MTRKKLFSNSCCTVIKTDHEYFTKTGDTVYTLWINDDLERDMFESISQYIKKNYCECDEPLLFETIEGIGIFNTPTDVFDSDMEDIFSNISLKYA